MYCTIIFYHCYTCSIYGSFRPEIKFIYLYLTKPESLSPSIDYALKVELRIFNRWRTTTQKYISTYIIFLQGNFI